MSDARAAGTLGLAVPALEEDGMSGWLMVIVGVVVALAGIWSIRLTIVAAAAGASWLVANAFGASFATGLLVAVAGGVLGLLLALLTATIEQDEQACAHDRTDGRAHHEEEDPGGE